MSTERLPATRQDLPALQRLMQKRGREEVGPLELDVWHGILLDEIAGRLDELQEVAIAIGSLIQKMESQQERIPQGRMRPFTKSITGDTVEVWEVYEEDVVGRPCTSASIYSDGPDSVWVALEDLRDGFQEIKEGESLDFSFKHPIIKRFFFKSTAGGTASLRIALEY